MIARTGPRQALAISLRWRVRYFAMDDFGMGSTPAEVVAAARRRLAEIRGYSTHALLRAQHRYRVARTRQARAEILVYLAHKARRGKASSPRS
jgi:hypothetical protein